MLDHLGLDALIPIGGDDTLSYGLRLHDEGVPVIAIPKTMDNDVHGTDYCIGFSTAVTRGVEFIHALRTSTGSHERIAVVELFGRYSGETSLITAYLAGADRAVISEVPFDVERLAGFLVEDKRRNPSNYSMVTISEGATIAGGEMVLSGDADAYGHRKLGGIGAATGDLIGRITGEGIVLQQVAYLMRSGSPDSLDLMVATNYAVMAADLVLEGASGRMVALRGGTYTNVPISVTRRASSASTSTSCTTSTPTARRSATSPASRCSCTDRHRRPGRRPVASRRSRWHSRVGTVRRPDGRGRSGTRHSSGGVSAALRWISSTTVASASVVVSPRLRPSATSRSRRRMILPLRVFGSSGVR